MTDDTVELYPINRQPAKPRPAPLNIARVRASIQALKRGEGFVIPAADLVNADGAFRSTPIGQRVHRIAKDCGVRISTKKIEGGLRVRREK